MRVARENEEDDEDGSFDFSYVSVRPDQRRRQLLESVREDSDVLISVVDTTSVTMMRYILWALRRGLR
jgi:hypothetical protein